MNNDDQEFSHIIQIISNAKMKEYYVRTILLTSHDTMKERVEGRKDKQNCKGERTYKYS